MSQENVEIVRGAFVAINRRGIDGALANAAEEFVMDWSNSIGPMKGIYTGKAEVRKVWTTFIEAFAELQWGPEEIIDVDESRVIAVNHPPDSRPGSGAAVEATGVQLWPFDDGKAQRVKLFQSKPEAFEAAGPRE